MIDNCTYRFLDGAVCSEPAHGHSTLCYWHNPDSDKGCPGLKERLEERVKNGKTLQGFQLSKARLENVSLNNADLRNANLSRAFLHRARMFNVNLSGANLLKAHLEKANLRRATLEGAELLGVFLKDTAMEGIVLGNGGKIRNEVEAENFLKSGDRVKAMEKYLEAEEIYRNIKTNFKNSGISYDAGIYFYREMTVKRLQMPYSTQRFVSKVVDLSTGYGERPFRIMSFSLVFILLYCVAFSLLGIHHTTGYFSRLLWGYSALENLAVLYDALYYSVVTFTTLGYGDYTPVGVGKAFAMTEAFFGPFLIALFVVTVYKKYMER